ncbi:hypothetical protein F5Y18DRAFT_236382 [Xylariaceae sp. FL1019]|nr:hypothetical protein F5Y18DRAFT_236382 [Xylariaceae sp. FL1019]
MSARLLQTSRTLLRAPRTSRLAVGSCIGLSLGVAVSQQPRVRFDGLSAPRSGTSSFTTSSPAFSSEHKPKKQSSLDPELMKQLSGGSVAGFLSGLVISVFSKTLVLLAGVAVVIIQVAARYGIDIVDQLRLKQRLGKSRVLAALETDPAFKLSFGLAFASSAFMQF